MTITDRQAMRADFEAYWIREHADPDFCAYARSDTDPASMPRLDGPGEPYIHETQDEAWRAGEAALEAAEAARECDPVSQVEIDWAQQNPGLPSSEVIMARLRSHGEAAPSSAEQPADTRVVAAVCAFMSAAPLCVRPMPGKQDAELLAATAKFDEGMEILRGMLNSTPPGAPEADERGRFETECRAKHPHLNLVRRDGRNGDTTYVNCYVQSAYELWQARAQSSAAPSVAPVSVRDGEDARRYRWLREFRAVDTDTFPSMPWAVNLVREHDMPALRLCNGSALDAAIDRAMGGES